jgi:hypothetical protein
VSELDQGFDLEHMLGLYLKGFKSGAASALKTHADMGDDEAIEEAMWMLRGIYHDPAVAETMRDKVREYMRGESTPPTPISTKVWRPLND